MEADYYHAQFPIEDSHWWYLGRRSILHKLLSRFAPRAAGRTLEIGCGGGGNLKLLSAFSVELAAVEMEAVAVNAARNRGLGDIQQGKLGDDLPALRCQYELIAMLDVLEHIDDDVDALQRVYKLLVPGGRYMITVPAYPFLWTRHDEMAHHCRRYTRSELIRKVREAGFEVKFSSYFNSLLFPLALATLLYAKFFKVDPEGAIEEPARPLNAILRKIFGLESRLLPALRFPFGLSIVVVAERSVQS